MNTLTANKQEILDSITETVKFFNIDGYNWNVEKPYMMVYRFSGQPIGSLIAERVEEMMHGKYPNQDFEISIKHGDYSVEVTLL